MKKLLARLLFFVPSLLLMAACSSSSKDEPDEPPTPVKLEISEVSVTGDMTADGGALAITLKAPAQPLASVDASWVKSAGVNNVGGVFVFSYTVDANTSLEARKATFTYSTAGQQVKCELTQKAVEVVASGNGSEKIIGLGWNLGNHLDAHINGVASETAWGNQVATQALFDKLKADGFTSVRIPVTWLGKVGPAPEYKIDEAWLDRVAEIVGYCEKAGLTAIVNIHHDGAESKYWLDVKTAATDPDTNARIKAQLSAMWTQIAKRFVDKGDFLIFEPFNELHDGGWGWGENLNDGGKQYACVSEWNQVFVDAVRAAGGQNATRWLAVVGYCSNPDLTMEHLVLPADPAKGRMMVAVHFYDPNTFTLENKYQQWGHTGQSGKKESWGNEEDINKLFARLVSKYAAQGIPVYIGEGGCAHRSDATGERFRAYYLEYVAKAARDSGMGYILWDNGATGAGKECHGYYNHGDGSYINNAEDMVKVLVKAYSTTDASYTLQSVYSSAPKP